MKKLFRRLMAGPGRTHPTVTHLGPRDCGPHGKTIEMRKRSRNWRRPNFVHEHAPAVKVVGGYYRKPGGLLPFVGPSRDRSLSGKARRRARQAAARAAR